MQRFVSKPRSIFSQQWDGSADSDLIKALDASGWTTFVQVPAEGQMVNSYDEDEQKWGPAPAKSTLVIVGPYRKQLYSLGEGQFLTWYDEDCAFATQDSAPKERDWDIDENTPARSWPSPAELVALADIDEIGW